MQLESDRREMRTGGDERFGREAGDDPEKAIKQTDDCPAAPARRAVWGDFEIGDQPIGTWRGHDGEFSDERCEVVRIEAIEHEMGDDEIERAGRAEAFPQVGMEKFDAFRGHLAAGDFQHLRAGVDDENACCGKASYAFRQKASMPFAGEQDAARRRDLCQEPHSAALQFFRQRLSFPSRGKTVPAGRNSSAAVMAGPAARGKVRHCSREGRRYGLRMFNGLKDSLSSTAAKSLLASRIDRYGKLTELRIRSREKTVFVEILLEGEDEAVGIHIDRYRVIGKGGEPAVVVEAVTASRPWLQNLLQDLLVGKPLPVPAVVLLALGKPED